MCSLLDWQFIGKFYAKIWPGLGERAGLTEGLRCCRVAGPCPDQTSQCSMRCFLAQPGLQTKTEALLSSPSHFKQEAPVFSSSRLEQQSALPAVNEAWCLITGASEE